MWVIIILHCLSYFNWSLQMILFCPPGVRVTMTAVTLPRWRGGGPLRAPQRLVAFACTPRGTPTLSTPSTLPLPSPTAVWAAWSPTWSSDALATAAGRVRGHTTSSPAGSIAPGRWSGGGAWSCSNRAWRGRRFGGGRNSLPREGNDDGNRRNGGRHRRRAGSPFLMSTPPGCAAQYFVI